MQFEMCDDDESTDWAVWLEKPMVGDGPCWCTTGGKVLTGSRIAMDFVARSLATMGSEARRYDGDGPTVDVFATSWKRALVAYGKSR